MQLSNYDVIILDCDGVVFDSNSLKLNAFRNVLGKYDPMIVEQFIDYFSNNFGTSRYKLVKVFIESFLKERYDNIKYLNILRDYGIECKLLYVEAKLTLHLLKFLNSYSKKIIYIASGSDEEELRLVFHKRELSKYFRGIHGSPIIKKSLVRDICSKHPKEKIVMVGDAMSDMHAATDNKVDFIFMRGYSVSQELKQYPGLTTIENLGDLF